LREDGIEAEKRAVERDMVELTGDFPIDCIDTEKPYKWFWTGKDTLAIPAMGQFTALTFHLAEEYLKPLLPAQSLEYLRPNFSTAEHVLEDIDKRRTRRWLKKIRVVPRSLRLIGAPIADGIYDTITQALYDDKQIEVTYIASSNEKGSPNTYAIHPYALIHRDATTELIGKIDKDNKIRRWPLHRMQTAHILNKISATPRSFDLDEFIESQLAHPLSGKQITLKLWICKEGFGQAHVLETRLSDDQQVEYVDDGLIVTATVYETIELKWWLLGMGQRVKVLEPSSLRNDIKDTLQAAAKLYK
jgi:predicted DNA-binding transcriptional regulator YafY